MRRGFVRGATKWLLGTVLAVLALVMLILVAIYIPPIQKFVITKVLDSINSKGELTIEASDIRLRFPLRIEIKDLMVKQRGDTMVAADRIALDGQLLPLLEGEIDVHDIILKKVAYAMGTRDSALYIRAAINDANLDHANIALLTQKISLDKFRLEGADIDMATRPDTIPKPEKKPSTAHWRISVKDILLSNISYHLDMVNTEDEPATNIAANLGSLAVKDTKVDLDGIKVSLKSFSLADSKAHYAKADAEPKPGFDPEYILADNIGIDIEDFSMFGSDLRVPITRLYANERSGLTLDATGTFSMDSTKISAEDFKIKTLASEIDLDAVYGIGKPQAEQPIDITLSAEIATADLQILLPDMRDIIDAMPQNRKIEAAANIKGTLDDLHVDEVRAEMPYYWVIGAKGAATNITDLNNAVGNLEIYGNIYNPDMLNNSVLKGKPKATVQLIPLNLKGNASMRSGLINGDIKATTADGDMALKAQWNNRITGYDLTLAADRFPAGSFLPGIPLGDVTANIDLKGHGLDFFSKKTGLDTKVEVIDVVYNGQHIRNLNLDANLKDGIADLCLRSNAPVLDADIDARGNLSGDNFTWEFAGDVANIDLMALGITDSVTNGSLKFKGNVGLTKKILPKPTRRQKNVSSGLPFSTIDATLDIEAFNFLLSHDRISGRDIGLRFNTTDSATTASLVDHDMALNFNSSMPLDSIIVRFDSTAVALNRMLTIRRADVKELQEKLPEFKLDFKAGRNNTLHNILKDKDISFRGITTHISNDSLISIDMGADTIIVGSTQLDRVDFNAKQSNEYLRYKIFINNQPGTFDEFAKIQANGYLAEDKFSIFMKQQNIEGKTGYNVGATIAMTDTTFTLKFVPFKPTIAYKPWTVNPDNYIILDTKQFGLQADVKMTNNVSSLRLYTLNDSTATANDSIRFNNQRIYLNMTDFKIEEWLALSPFAPPMKGTLSADLNVGRGDHSMTGNGKIRLADFIYNKRRVGTFDLDINLTTDRSGAIYASTDMSVDSVRVLSAEGTLNDTTALYPFLLDVNIDRLPLKIVNPFISSTGSLTGYLNGQMDVTGSLKEPEFDGFVAFDSASVKVDMIGSSFKFSDNKIPVDSNIVRLDGYQIFGSNKNPLEINGTVDFKRITDVQIDLSMNAENMQVVGNSKRRGSDVYGKAFVSIEATAKGNLRFINVDADLTVEPQTNVTYIIPDATSNLVSRSNSDMVKFVNFANTVQVEKADSLAAPPTAVMINAKLNLSTGSTIGIDLSTDGKNRVQLQPSGTLDYAMTPMGDSRFTGRINIDNGFARYTPPLMGEKMFNFENGSYVTFSGDMMNPTLNVKAVDHILANVTQEGQNSRLITFDVWLKVTGTLDRMDISFDLSTNDDVTVQNELQSMSPEQRANQAMNLLLYNTYTGPNTRGNANIGGNALYSFVESTVNNWMANNIKGVDISFGIDQYERTHDGYSQTATSYSYKVSKSFMDDRIKIVVGGNYSTDADPDENVSENLINDISVEYYLNNTGTMYLKLFRHTGFESILEGEVTQTGVGFVFKRKLRRLRDIFSRNATKKNVSPKVDDKK